MSREFFTQKDERAEVKQQNILPPAFWEAFIEAKYPAELGDGFSHHLELAAQFLGQGRGYLSTEMVYSYILNIVAVKGACYINLYTEGDLTKRLGVVSVNPAMGWREVKYMTGPMDAYPQALDILRKIQQEFFQRGFDLATSAFPHGNLPFARPVKCILAATRWETILRDDPQLSPVQKASIIARDLDLDSQTAAEYAKWSDNYAVRVEAEQAAGLLYEKKVDVQGKWKTLSQENPDLSPMEMVELIAQDVDLDASTVASLASLSDDPKASREARLGFFNLAGNKAGIYEMWEELLSSHPTWSPLEKVQWIAKQTGLAPMSVCIYARASDNPQIRAEASKAHFQLGDAIHQITTRWRDIIHNSPQLDFHAQVKQVAKEAGVSPGTAVMYASGSPDADVKKHARHASGRISDEKHGITARLVTGRGSNVPFQDLVSLVNQIANDTGLDPIYVARIACSSPDAVIRSRAVKVGFFLYNERFGITKKWQVLLAQESPLSVDKQARAIGEACGISPRTVCIYG